MVTLTGPFADARSLGNLTKFLNGICVLLEAALFVWSTNVMARELHIEAVAEIFDKLFHALPCELYLRRIVHSVMKLNETHCVLDRVSPVNLPQALKWFAEGRAWSPVGTAFALIVSTQTR